MKKKIEILSKDKNFYVENETDFQSLQSKGFGETKNSMFYFSIYEVLFLLEKEKITLSSKKTKEELLKSKKLKLENYLVFKDLTQKGFLLKTGLKYGADFRAYEKGSQNHAKYLLLIYKQNEKINLKEIFAQTRVAHSTHKKLLLALIDDDYSISYLELEWKKI